jgi:hypothetical protein
MNGNVSKEKGVSADDRGLVFKTTASPHKFKVASQECRLFRADLSVVGLTPTVVI